MTLTSDDKVRIEELYLAGVNAKDISKRIDKSVEAIRKYIQRNLKHLKDTHEREERRTKEILNKTRFECGQLISNNSFFKSNRSIYKLDKKNGDLVVDVKVAPVVSFDTPRRIKKNIFK